jgi:hypothetical protein
MYSKQKMEERKNRKRKKEYKVMLNLCKCVLEAAPSLVVHLGLHWFLKVETSVKSNQQSNGGWLSVHVSNRSGISAHETNQLVLRLRLLRVRVDVYLSAVPDAHVVRSRPSGLVARVVFDTIFFAKFHIFLFLRKFAAI